MKYFYEPGCVRWVKHSGRSDVRSHRSPEGWTSEAEFTDVYPITLKQLPQAKWWIREHYVG